MEPQYDLEDYRARVVSEPGLLIPYSQPSEPTDPEELQKQMNIIENLIDQAYKLGQPYIDVSEWHQNVVYKVMNKFQNSFPHMKYVREGTYFPVFMLYLDYQYDDSCIII